VNAKSTLPGPTLLLTCLLLGCLATGCAYVQASGTFGSRLDPARIASIEAGVTTKAQVLALLGPPEEFLRSEVLGSLADDATRVSGAIALGNRAQDAFTYQFDTVEARGTMLLFYNFVRGRVESDLLVVFFDEADRVRELGFRRVERRQ
jgi:hypothetical protein